MRSSILLLAVCLALSIVSASAFTAHYVDASGTNPVAPYTTWSTAATNIQDAANAAGSGDVVLVTNGVYQFGGSSNTGSNRVVVPFGVNLQSVNGPTVTIIKGYQVPGTTNGTSAVRCVYLNQFSTLAGFTLTNGATQSSGSGGPASGGGVLVNNADCVISNCIIAGNAAYYSGGGIFGNLYSPPVIRCVLSGNTAQYGGGAYVSVLSDCVVSNNNATYGGGLYNCAATNCLLAGNGHTNNTTGGAAYNSGLNNCTIVGNFEHGLGASEGCTLNNCIIYYNTAAVGLWSDCYACRLTNCCAFDVETPGSAVNLITNAPAFVDLAGANYRLQLGSPCINAGTNLIASSGPDLDGNPRIVGGTVDIGAYENQNTSPVHYVDLNCTNPLAPYTNWLTAATNIQDAVAAAQAGEFVVANDGIYTNGGTVMFGSETNRVALTNAVTLLSLNGAAAATIAGGTQTRCVYVGSNSVLIGFTLTNGRAVVSGDITNEQSGMGAWCEPGGVISNCFITGNLSQSAYGLGGGAFGGTIYNCILSNNAAADGAGAAFSTVDNCMIVSNGWLGTANLGGGLYFSTASNCVITANRGYSGGGGAHQSTLYNCTLFTNWSQFNGGAAYQCLLYHCALNTNASLVGVGGAYQCFLTNCTVTGNYGNFGGVSFSTNYNCIFAGNAGTDATGGGGIHAGIAYNCIFKNNNNRYNGGGAAAATLYNCLLAGNAANDGGGTYNCVLNNCTVVGNLATNIGGGVYVTSGSANNSIVYYNHTPSGNDANYFGAKFNFSCSFPITGGLVTTNPPLFVDTNSDFHLLPNSPCINSGTNLYATNSIPFVAVDLDGNARIVGSAADIGAYEYQSPASVLPYSWLWRYGLATDGSADYADSDGDGMSDYAEWKAGTNPTNSASLLALQSPAATTTNATITWQSVSGIRYFVQRGSDLSAQPVFTAIASNIVGQAVTTSYNDTTATNSVPYFYRVGVP